MKNFVLFLIIALSLVSCEDNEINEFAMQAKVGERLYTSTEAQASVIGNGKLIIQGSTRLEALTLNLSRLRVGDYPLSQNSSNFAVFSDMDGKIYTTNPNGGGLVNISEVNQANRTLSGTFNFNAILPGSDTIYVSKGVLYNIPYVGGNINNPDDAGTITANVDGEPFVATLVSAGGTENSIAIFGSTISATIALTFPITVEVGEYNLPQNGFSAKYQDESGTQTSSEGTISITEHLVAVRSIKGTFSFVTSRNEITEGQFDILY